MPGIYLSLILLLIGVVFFATYIFSMARLEKKLDRPGPSQFMVVLGGRVKADGSMSRVLARRTALAADLYSRGFAPYVIVSGGRGGDEPASEADTMQAELIRLGVPGEAIMIENKSANTWANLENTAALLAGAGMLSGNGEIKEEPILIVTSIYHLPRAAYIAYQQGWRNITCAGASSPAHLLFLNRIREVFAWLKHFITHGMSNSTFPAGEK